MIWWQAPTGVCCHVLPTLEEMMRVAETARALLEGVVFDGGSTVDPNTGDVVPVQTGYVVGGLVPSERVRTLTESVAERFVTESGPYPEGRYVGSWEDGGHVYLDVVEVFDSREEALSIARGRGEIAVYDAAAKESVNVWTAA